ncbi:MAG: HD domain-containing protein [Candidatus Woesearchaeota archaeon]
MEHIKNHPKVQALLERADTFLKNIGYTEHGRRHAELVSKIAYNILQRLDYPVRDQKLAEIAGYLHDIGNIINREHHAQSGAMIAYNLLTELSFNYDDIIDVTGAIGTHHEVGGYPVNYISAALIIADKTDVHKSRVRNANTTSFDVHDRVNWAVERSFLKVLPEQKLIVLELQIDTKVSPVLEYFEIFLDRMLITKKAAEFLGCAFEMEINGKKLV